MKSVKTFRMLLCASIALAAATSAWGQPYDVYKNGVPDVTKQVPDNSCWLACASNVLGGAGWGNANTIYNDMVNQFGTALGGHPHAAAKWWVHNVGLNSAMAGQGYNPTADYVNFHLVDHTLTAADYDYLLDELNRCQYVAVSWFWGGDLGHCLTMVGGNYATRASAFGVSQSVWHDSDDIAAPVPTDVVKNNIGFTATAVAPFTPPGTTWMIPIGANQAWSDRAFLACPGVPKPASAIGNFDVHYYIGVGPVDPQGNPNGYTTQVEMVATGSNYRTYTAIDPNIVGFETFEPVWDDDAQLPTLVVPNEDTDDLHKELYISVDFHDPIADPDNNVPDIGVFYDDHLGIEIEVDLDSYEWASDNGQVLLTYVFPEQPGFERVVFPDNSYKTLAGNVFQWNLATECVPEPMTLTLALLGGAVLALRRRR